MRKFEITSLICVRYCLAVVGFLSIVFLALIPTMRLKILFAKSLSHSLSFMRVLFPFLTWNKPKFPKGKSIRWVLRDVEKRKSKYEVSLLFSGGCDSLLTAYLLAKKFKRVHLLTFNCNHLKSIENSTISYNFLLKKFNKNKFTHKIINVDHRFKRFLYDGYFKDFLKYGLMRYNFCIPCHLSMVLQAIDYCTKNKINFLSDGTTLDSRNSQSLFNSDKILKRRIKMYKKFGITILPNPSRFIENPDSTLFELGILHSDKIKHCKKTTYKIQPFCVLSIPLFFFKTYYYPLIHGKDKYLKKHMEFADKICISCLNETDTLL